MRSDGRRCRTCTQQRDRDAKHRKTKTYTETHCKNGHEYTPENTTQDGAYRCCKTCKRESKQRQRAGTTATRTVLITTEPPDVRWMPTCAACAGFGFVQRSGAAWSRCTAPHCVGGYRFDLVGAS
jgi:hypothetical protein